MHGLNNIKTGITVVAVGLGFTVVTYLIAPGGHYLIAGGAFLVGGIQLVVGLVQFLVYLFNNYRSDHSAPKKKADASSEDLSEISTYLRVMGYDLTNYGAGVALAERASGYSKAEVASHIAHVTLALDVKEAGSDPLRLTRLAAHGRALLDVLKSYKDDGLMHPTQWQNDSRAVIGIATVNKEQLEWIEKVLSDPIAGKCRLATSRITQVAP